MIINGSDLMLFLDGYSLAGATSHTITIEADTIETMSKNSGGKWSKPKTTLLSWEVQTDNLVILDDNYLDFDYMMNLLLEESIITGVFALKGEQTDNGWTSKTNNGYSGKMQITSLNLNADNGEKATYSASFKGVGELNKL